MLDLADYQKITNFMDTIHSHLFFDKEAKSFRDRVSISLGKILGYNHVIYGYIDTPKTRTISFDVMIHNLDMDFVQKFLTSSFIQDKEFYDKNDVAILSELPNYQKRMLYKELLAPHKLSDFMLFYLKAQNDYTGYIIVFKEDLQKTFEKKDRDIAEAIQGFIGVEYFNYISYLSLKSNNDLLITQTNYYPIGIIIMKNFHEATYANETAKDYMADLEISNLKFFSMFFTNNILPYIKYELRSIGKKHLIRYKNYIFSIVSMNPFSESFFKGMEKPVIISTLGNLFKSQETISYIYIFKDEFSSFSDNQDFFADYTFTHQQEKIVELILLGYNNKQIAEELDISINTVRVHMQNIYKKTDVSNRTEFLFKLNNQRI